jgi:hypothetical protein
MAQARQVWAAPNGGAAAVKEVQKRLKVVLFKDVPEADGYALLANMMLLARKFGLT